MNFELELPKMCIKDDYHMGMHFAAKENGKIGINSLDLAKFYLENEDLEINFEDLKPFNTAKATVIEILQEERKSDFLDAFMQTDILNKYYAYDSPVDICIRLNYENGNFLIIWSDYKKNSFAGYIGEYSADGTVLSFWGSFSSLSYYQQRCRKYLPPALVRALEQLFSRIDEISSNLLFLLMDKYL